MKTSETIEEILACYQAHGHEDYIGEAISQIEHMSQAAQLAEKEGYDQEVILAAFLHDFGHICPKPANAGEMGGYGRASHEKIGADYLRERGFPEKIAKLVENHVQAKRYLTFAHPDYLARLSEASKMTLDYQGGPMSAEEAAKFSSDPLFDLSIKMRQWDEEAKEVGIPLVELDYFKGLMERVLGE
ncbi:MAG: HDIG domain-containing protein [Bacteroidia bacterium]|nr:HDIG domain-containing protein [Bacteroidia bacterium]